MLKIEDTANFSNIETPFYYYDMDLFRRTLDTVWDLAVKYNIQVHYAIKANADRRLLELLSSKGFGADCVSGNEVVFARECGFSSDKIMFAGVGKSDKEISRAINMEIQAINCESLQELGVIDALATHFGVRANVALRINPNIDAHTHRYITTGLYENKFGISAHQFDQAIAMIKSAKSIDFTGLQFHIGSQITRVEEVYKLECQIVNQIVDYFESQGLTVKTIDIGGGLGVDYENPDENPIADFDTWFKTIDSTIKRRDDQTVHVEPGRSMVAQCGSLISTVLFTKAGETKNFLILDAGMNDLIRPALYGAYHKIENMTAFYKRRQGIPDSIYDVVGPVCETSDMWGSGRTMRKGERGDIVAIRTAGAYGQVMSSRYNLKNLALAVYSDRLRYAVHKIDYLKK